MADRPGVIFVTMGDDDPPHLLLLIEQVAEIGDDVVDPQHVVFREHQPGVDDQDVFTILHGHHVLADFAQAPQGHQS